MQPTAILNQSNLMLFRFEDLTRDKRILAVIAIGLATVVILHFVIFELPRLWRTALERAGDGLAFMRELLDHPPTRPQWLDDTPERRQPLNPVVIPFEPRRVR